MNGGSKAGAVRIGGDQRPRGQDVSLVVRPQAPLLNQTITDGIILLRKDVQLLRLGRVVNQGGGFTIAWSYDSLFNGQWRGL